MVISTFNSLTVGGKENMIDEIKELKEILTAVNGYASNKLSKDVTFGSLGIEDKIDVLKECIRKMALIQLQEYTE